MIMLSGRKRIRPNDLTYVNRKAEPTSGSIHGQAVLADREYSDITIRAHYRSVASPCG